MNKGIDVSSHQGTIDWKQVKGEARGGCLSENDFRKEI